MKNYQTRHSLPFLLLLFLLSCIRPETIEAQYVYHTPSGTKYHLESCRMIENTSARVTLQDAADLKLTSCSFCTPPELNKGLVDSPVLQPAPSLGKSSKQGKAAISRNFTFSKCINFIYYVQE